MYKIKAGCLDMSFPERRYEFQGAFDPIFGIGPTPGGDLNASVPNIPNFGSRCGLGVNHGHIAFQQITCPSGSFLVPANMVNYFWDGTSELILKIGEHDAT